MSARNDDLRRWLAHAADRDHPAVQAAVLVVCEGACGDLAPIIDTEPATGRAWIHWATVTKTAAGCSGGERRLLALASSLAAGEPVDLADALTGLDDRNAALVVEAIAHAAGVDLTALTRGDHQ